MMVEKEKQKDFKNTDKQMQRKITIGRDASCQIWINDPSNKVSRIHASLFWDGRRLILEDQSSNGTVVNGRLVHHSRVEIKNGDTIYLGNSVLLSWNEINRFFSSKQRNPVSFGKIATLGALVFSGIVVAIIIVYMVISNSPPDDGSVADENGDCRIFTASSFTWDGNCLDGYANGTGTLTWTSGKRYHGEIHNGHITGKGKEYQNEQLVYEGDFVDGVWEGKGTLYQNNYPVYVGEFSNNSFDGYGTLYFDNSSEIARKGYFVEGQFRDEEKANDKCEQIGREIVYEYFNGGTNIQSNLYAIKIDQAEENVEMTIDLTFNGNRITSNFYSCRVVVRNHGEPLVEFVECNDNAQLLINIHNYVEDLINIVNILEQI
jgi:hypothetical protein